MNKIEFQDKIIQAFKMAQNLEETFKQNKLLSTLYKDKQRELRQIFEKTFHEPIDKYIKI